MSDYVTTPYGDVKKKILDLAAEVQLLVCDVDGVLSDGLIYMGNAVKLFHRNGLLCQKLVKREAGTLQPLLAQLQNMTGLIEQAPVVAHQQVTSAMSGQLLA